MQRRNQQIQINHREKPVSLFLQPPFKRTPMLIQTIHKINKEKKTITHLEKNAI